MDFFHKIKGLFNKIFKRDNDNKLLDFVEEPKSEISEQIPIQESKIYEPIELPEGELVSFTDEVLDTESRENIEKFKHNLAILVKKAKEAGKIDKFVLIREDDFFPDDWEWRVLSKNTNLEKVHTDLSLQLKEEYALKQSGLSKYREVNGIKMPNLITQDQIYEALSKVDKMFGAILLPSRFRSTKHFTVNTALGVTGSYNFVSTNRDYIIMDDIGEFLNSNYGYSVAYHDAYLDISHESLPISDKAVVLIDDEKYERIMQDEKVAKQLAQRRVIRFKGDEDIAINMILSEMGALPSRVGSRYVTYDKEMYDILDNSIKSLAEQNGLFFGKSHGGKLRPNGGHFSNYYDDKNTDYAESLNEFIDFLRHRFPEHENLFPKYFSITERSSKELIEQLGTDSLLEAIEEYNLIQTEKINVSFEQYKQDRKTITPEIHQQFVDTITLINNFYNSDLNYQAYNAEEAIRKFIQSGTVKEQLEAAKQVWELLPSKDLVRTESASIHAEGISSDKKIDFAEVAKNALENTTTERVHEVDRIEKTKLSHEHVNEGEEIDD